MSSILVAISKFGNRWVPGTEEISEVGYRENFKRWVPLGTDKILELGYSWVPGTDKFSGYEKIYKVQYSEVIAFNRYRRGPETCPHRRKRSKVDASIFRLGAESNSSLGRVGKKEEKIACPILDDFACGQFSSSRLYRLNPG